jgi:hypothetical protein
MAHQTENANMQLADLPDRICLPLRSDPMPLMDEVQQLPTDAWVRHFVPDNYRGDWSVVPLRAPAGALHPILQITSPPGCTEWIETAYLGACPAIRSVLDLLQCEIDAVRLMRLGPGSEIHEHRDHDLSVEFGSARLHLPLTTCPDVEFLVNRRPVAMQKGEWWYLRLSDPHAVVNRGASDRIHLVVDVRTNDWLMAMMHAAVTAH